MICIRCGKDQPVEVYYYTNKKRDDRRDSTCKFCRSVERQSRRFVDHTPLMEEIQRQLQQHGELTSKQLSALIDVDLQKIGGLMGNEWRAGKRFIRKLVDNTSVWALIGHQNPAFRAFDPNQKEVNDCRSQNPAVATKMHSIGIDADDLVWMKHYQESAARRGLKFNNCLNQWVVLPYRMVNTNHGASA